jgi:hypothetical protein
MRLRKLLLTTGAIVAAGAMALAPAAQATTPGGPIATVAVGGSTVNGTHNIAGTMKSAAVALPVYGIPLTINCTAGTGGGVVRSGTLGVPTYEMTLTSVNITCPSIFPGTTVTKSVICDVDVDFNDLVHAGLTDTGAVPANKFHRVAGTAYVTNSAGADCTRVTISNGCTYTMGGSASVYLDEAIKVVGGVTYQDLYLSGTLKIHNPINCAGAVSANQDVTLNAVLNVRAPDGVIDFQ